MLSIPFPSIPRESLIRIPLDVTGENSPFRKHGRIDECFSFFRLGVYSPWVVLPMFIRDVFVDGLRSYCAAGQRAAPANPWGKVKFLLQLLSLTAAAWCLMTGATSLWAEGLLVAALAVSLPGAMRLAHAAARLERGTA